MSKHSRLIILFGSRAKGTANQQSDVDVAALADHPLDLPEKTELAQKIAGRFSVSEDKVDVVDLWAASPLLQYQIAETGQLLEGDGFDFIRFRVLAWKRYQDTAKFRRIREESLSRYVQRNNT